MIDGLDRPAFAAGAEAPPAPPARSVRQAVLAALVLAPVAGLLVYLGIRHDGTEQPVTHAAHGLGLQQLEAVVDRLASRLEKHPNDAGGWAMLARTQAVLGRFEQANASYARAIALDAGNAQLLADAADALARAQNSRLSGEPERLVERALQADPANAKALALAGSAAFERKDYARAVAFWQRLSSLVPAGSEFAASTQRDIEQARRLAMMRAPGAPRPPAPEPVRTESVFPRR